MKVQFRKTNKRSIIFYIGGLVFTIISLFLTLTFTQLKDSYATSFTWAGSSENLHGEIDENVPYTTLKNYQAECTTKSVQIGAATDLHGQSFHNVCVYNAPSFSYGWLERNIGYSESSFVISIGSDTRMYKVGNAEFLLNKGIKGTDDFIYLEYVPQQGGFTSYIFRNLHTKLTPVHTIFGDVASYTLSTEREYLVADENDNPLPLRNSYGLSDNKKWIVFEVVGRGFFLMNLDEKSVKWINASGWGSGPQVEFAISDEGKRIAWGGWNVTAGITEIDGTCGVVSSSGFLSAWKTGNPDTYLTNGCQMIDLSSRLRAVASPVLGSFFPSQPRFNVDGGELTYWWNVGLKLKAHGYAGPEPIGYLAMGDLYASGEGDIDTINNTDIKWYLDSTNINGDYSLGIPREKCHVSLRSYPYQLNKIMKPEGGFKSVACSGALINDVGGSNSDYLGQVRGGNNNGEKPRLEGLANNASFKYDGLLNSIQGRNTQIEFVKKHKPKVITVMAGGNDIGFADKLENCVTHQSICEWATESGRAILKSEIDANYDKLESLYKALYEESDGAKIYVVGYPQFVSPDENAQCSSIFNLHPEERQMIYSAIEYMNEVIHKAASTAGSKYVDIEGSLTGNRICESDNPYVNPIVGKAVVSSPSLWGHEEQESFHPNAKGHAKVTNAILDQLNWQYPNEYDICPDSETNSCPSEYIIDTPEYFQNLDEVNAVYETITSSLLVKQTEQIVKIPKYSLNPGSEVVIEVHSEPTQLVTAIAESDGSLSESIIIPSSVGAGYHSLIVKGKTYSGESIIISQEVEVRGSDPNDIDEDGIAEAIDKCAYLPQLNEDYDLDGTDDGCDPHISDSPILYRARLGNENRIHNGISEHDNYIYIERNTRAGSITSVTGDYDPDGDGWAIVGVSQGTPYTTQTVPDTGPIANFKVVGSGSGAKPYVYIRAGGYGCTSFIPTSLGKVLSGQSRTIKKVTQDTDGCRPEAKTEDLDFNGQADNVQPIYTARKGNASIVHIKPDGSTFNEDSNRLYIFRSFHAAEAQLGISDYSPTGTTAGNSDELIQTWNLLASTQTLQTIPDFNKVTLAEDSEGEPLPIILTKKQNGQCIAYRPESTTVIKQTTQLTRDIIKLNQLPQGVSCD